jgi:plastocyanin
MSASSSGDTSPVSRYRLIIEIVAVIAVVIAISFFAGRDQTPEIQPTVEAGAPPAMTELMRQVLAESTGFQHLVSYTDDGFVPQTLDVKEGETVRFTNNATRDLWIAAAQTGSTTLYPSGPNEMCGQSAFDSCVSLKPLEFWEFTFDTSGEWSYRNNASPDDIGVISVD